LLPTKVATVAEEMATTGNDAMQVATTETVGVKAKERVEKAATNVLDAVVAMDKVVGKGGNGDATRAGAVAEITRNVMTTTMVSITSTGTTDGEEKMAAMGKVYSGDKDRVVREGGSGDATRAGAVAEITKSAMTTTTVNGTSSGITDGEERMEAWLLVVAKVSGDKDKAVGSGDATKVGAVDEITKNAMMATTVNGTCSGTTDGEERMAAMGKVYSGDKDKAVRKEASGVAMRVGAVAEPMKNATTTTMVSITSSGTTDGEERMEGA
jgi:hypothetical protein